MSTILVEDRVCPLARPALSLIAQTCRDMGFDVFRWRGPFSGRVGHWRHLFPCDLAILFNGAHPRYEPALAKLRRMGAKTLFVELGWHPQKGTCQIDPQGINAAASWASEPLAVAGRTPLAVRPAGDLLVILQLDSDTQITHLSPYFRDMRQFVEFIARHSPLPVRVRQHPRAPADPTLRDLALSLGATWDTSPSLQTALERCRAVACVNSSSGVEALCLGLPVLCYGKAIYRHPGVVYCLDDRPNATRSALEEVASGTPRLFQERIAALLARVFDHQWAHDQIPARLPALIRSLVGSVDGTNAGRRHWSFHRALRDFPATLQSLRRVV